MDFVEEFFVAPLREPGAYAPYNAVNTLAYAALGLVAAFVLYKILKARGMRIDYSLFLCVLPFVVFGSALRVIQDADLLPRSIDLFGATVYPFVTPGIYFVTFALLVVAFAALGKSRTNVQLAGWTLALLPLAALFPHFANFLHAAAIALLAFAALKAGEWLGRREMLEKAALLGQALDGAASFVGLSFAPAGTAYFEQHVVAGGVIGLLTPFGFLLLKFGFALAVIELLKREDPEEKAFVLGLVAIMGFAPGLRDALRILAGV
ncbi:MAG: DUF63 family protein [Candidatus Micrarchaeia archaeon]